MGGAPAGKGLAKGGRGPVQFCIYKTVPTRSAKKPREKTRQKTPDKNNKTPAKTHFSNRP
jgi:hypothetical protein